MFDFKVCRVDADVGIESVDEGFHALSGTKDHAKRTISGPIFCEPADSHGGFGLTVFAQERRVANYSVEASFEVCGKPGWMLEIISYKLFEDSEPFIKFEQHDFWPLLFVLGSQKILEMQKDTRS